VAVISGTTPFYIKEADWLAKVTDMKAAEFADASGGGTPWTWPQTGVGGAPNVLALAIGYDGRAAS
jgi:hypothetical protein